MTDRGRVYPMLRTSVPPSALDVATDVIDDLQAQLRLLRIERVRIASVLDTFAHAELSMLSIQPVLDLARELNGNGTVSAERAQSPTTETISAAPELLDTLREVLDYWESTGFAECAPDCDCIVDSVRAAIKGAR